MMLKIAAVLIAVLAVSALFMFRIVCKYRKELKEEKKEKTNYESILEKEKKAREGTHANSVSVTVEQLHEYAKKN